jgi:hypothetical protein
LEGAGGEQHPGVRGGATEGEGESEANQAEKEDPFAAPQVAELAAEQQEAAEGEGVGGDDPGPVGSEKPRAVCMRGRAMFTMVVSRMTISWAMEMATSAFHRFGSRVVLFMDAFLTVKRVDVPRRRSGAFCWWPRGL